MNLEQIRKNISREQLIEYYMQHNAKDTIVHFNIAKNKFWELIKYYKIVKPKGSKAISGRNSYNNGEKVIYLAPGDEIPKGYHKGGLATRTHEEYIKDGEKSSETQKANKEVNNKKLEEKYGSLDNYYIDRKEKSAQGRIAACGSLEASYAKGVKTLQENAINNFGSLEAYYARTGNSMKNYWYNNFAEEERKEWIKTSLAHGAGWNTKKIKGNDSGPNKKFKKLLEDNNIALDETEFRLVNYHYDFKIGNILIEINPSATHNSTWNVFKSGPGLDKDYHKNKSLLAGEKGYRCIHVWDWDNIDAILALLKDRSIVYARQCELKEVDYNEAKEFLENYHVQGYAKDEIRLGLYEKDQLVSIMTFGKPRYNKKYDYELVRYCSIKNITGGAEKLFKHFVEVYSPNSIISYCDLSKFNGETYNKLGFKLQRKNAPSKHWFNLANGKHITDNLLRQRGYDQLFGTNFGKGTSNKEFMLKNGFVEVYDCGQATYTWQK